MKVAGLVLVIFGMFLWVGALLMFAGLTREVAKAKPSQQSRRVSKLADTANPLRIWREHRRQFPYSSRRKAALVLVAATVACVAIGFYFAK